MTRDEVINLFIEAIEQAKREAPCKFQVSEIVVVKFAALLVAAQVEVDAQIAESYKSIEGRAIAEQIRGLTKSNTEV